MEQPSIIQTVHEVNRKPSSPHSLSAVGQAQQGLRRRGDARRQWLGRRMSISLHHVAFFHGVRRHRRHRRSLRLAWSLRSPASFSFSSCRHPAGVKRCRGRRRRKRMILHGHRHSVEDGVDNRQGGQLVAVLQSLTGCEDDGTAGAIKGHNGWHRRRSRGLSSEGKSTRGTRGIARYGASSTRYVGC